ncbi:MAG: hypothetical protein Q8M07_14220, partial [Prosthecobacter sp.]|nr:hypothetical protein [Prosthecobacter sp.]
MKPNLFRELTTALLCGLILLQSAIAVAPEWWTTRGVLTPGKAADDHAVANVGQLKHLAQKAAQELDSSLPGGAGTAIHALLAAWQSPPAPGITREDYAAVTLGQLKAVARPFYERLAAAGVLPAGVYPWSTTGQAADDFAAANLGQLKAVFAFHPAQDSDGDGYSDAHEHAAGTDPLNAQHHPGMTTDGGGGTGGTTGGGGSTGGGSTGGTGGGTTGGGGSTPPEPVVESGFKLFTAWRFRQVTYDGGEEAVYPMSPETTTTHSGWMKPDPSHPPPSADDGFNGDADEQGNTADPGDPRDEVQHAPPELVPAQEEEEGAFWHEQSIGFGGDQIVGPPEAAAKFNPYRASNAYSPPDLREGSGGFSVSTALGHLESVSYHRGAETNGWMGNGYRGLGQYQVYSTLRSWQQTDHYSYADEDGQQQEGQIELQRTTAHMSQGQLRLQCNQQRGAGDAPLSAAFLLVKETKAIGGTEAEQTEVKAAIELRIVSGQVSTEHTITSGALPEGEVTAAAGVITVRSPAPVNGKIVRYYLLPIDIEEVFERDQKWNKIPNPKNPSSYSNAVGWRTDQLRNVLFVAVEPTSTKAEVTVKTTAPSTIGGSPVLCCVVNASSNQILPEVATISSGTANLTFSPGGSVHDIGYEVRLGIDKNNDGSLSMEELVPKSEDPAKALFLRVVSASDYSKALSQLDWRDDTVPLYVAKSFLRYFDGNNATLTEGVAQTPITVPVTATEPTHIAGSAYAASNGDTQIPLFKLPDGSTASDKIEDTFAAT